VNKHTRPTWIGKYPRTQAVEKQVGEAPLDDELKRLKKEKARLKEEREILKVAATTSGVSGLRAGETKRIVV